MNIEELCAPATPAAQPPMRYQEPRSVILDFPDRPVIHLFDPRDGSTIRRPYNCCDSDGRLGASENC